MDRPLSSTDETSEPAVTDISRREVVRRASGLIAVAVARVALAPAALFLFAEDAGAQLPTNTQVIASLNFALVLEQLESVFYRTVLGATNFASVRAQLNTPEIVALAQISKHEDAHVLFLKSLIGQLGGVPNVINDAQFDVSGGNGSNSGPFIAAATDRVVLLDLAQTLEDLGARAYRGQLATLYANRTAIEAAMRIHAVEARHAAQIRRLRGVKPWVIGKKSEITGLAGTTPNSGTAQALVDAAYLGEDNVSHDPNPNDIIGLGVNNGGIDAVTSAFDEPLTQAQVTAIIQDFVQGTTP